MRESRVDVKVSNFFVLFFVGLMFFGLKCYGDDTFGKPFVQTGNSKMVNAVALSPNKKFIISGGGDKRIFLWDVKSSKQIKVFLGHQEPIRTVKFSPNGKYIISGSRDSTIKLWDIKSGKEIKTFIGHTKEVDCIGFSPNGKYIISGSNDNTIRLWDVKSGKEIRRFIGHSGRVTSVVFSEDGKNIVSGSFDKSIKLWDIESGKEIQTFTDHTGYVFSVAFSPNGKYIASGSYDKSIKLWNIESGKEIKALRGHTKFVSSVAFTPDGKHIFSESADGSIKLWDIERSKSIKTFQFDTIHSVEFSSDGKDITIGSLNSIKLLDSISGKEIKTFGGNVNIEFFVALSPNGKNIISGGINTLSQWNKGTMLKRLKGVDYSAYYVKFSPSGQYIITLNRKSTIELWDVSTGKVIKTFRGHSDIESIAFSPNGQYIISGSKKSIKLWNIETGEIIKEVKGTGSSIGFSPNGKYITSGSWDGTIKLWNIESPNEIKVFRGHTASVSVVAFSSNNKYIISGSTDNSIRLWDIATGKELKVFKGHIDFVRSVLFINNDKYIVSGSLDNTIKLWDVSTGKEIRTFRGHSAWVCSVSVSPDGKYIISGGWDGTIKKWDIKTGKELVSMISFKDGEWITITPDGYFDASSKEAAKHMNILVDPLTVTGMDGYYEKFYRPDIVKLALEGKSVPNLAKISNVKPAPIVRIVNTRKEDNKLKFTLEVSPRSGGVGDIRLYHNGTAVVDTKAVSTGKKIKKPYSITLVEGNNTINAIAFERTNSKHSEEAVYTVKSAKKRVVKPNIHALVVGIEEFGESTLNNLEYSYEDAKLVEATLNNQEQGYFNKVFVTTLATKEQTSKENILKALKKFKNIAKDDLFVLYFSSHGMVDNGEYYLISSNVGANSMHNVKEEALSGKAIQKLISNIPALKKLMVFDTCYSGALGDLLDKRIYVEGLSEKAAIESLHSEMGRGTAIFSASTSSEEAIANGYKGHSIFTRILVDGLKGLADSGREDGFVSTKELDSYVDEELPLVSKEKFQYEQFPVSRVSSPAFRVSWVEK